ncbi:hypothetical protein P691DRAFT_493426 [Macrolepiota fuliginosa MF-IS2]|uniref:Uncharacterized protein n=1 Tax=Macrolepiota fuliginosa MF-IS2 TaxID=1400762 RepID=A0A9P5XF38_9AGAR|nr:hypothetical protein P691DRAFT_493426 [Macrolepiota fuliginosa MF-IS2]
MGRNQTHSSASQARPYPTTSFRSSSSGQTRMSFPNPNEHRAMKGGSRSMQSSPYQSFTGRGAEGGPSRSNPMTPTWDAGPRQIQGNVPTRNRNAQSSPLTIRPPGRKAASTVPPMWDPENEPRSTHISRMTPTPRKRPPIEIAKSTNSPAPLWQHQDAAHEARQKAERRMNKLGEPGDRARFEKSAVAPRRWYLNPALQVVQDQALSEDESDSDSPMDVDQAPQRALGMKSALPVPAHIRNPANQKAARKTKWPQPRRNPSDESSSESSASTSESSDSIIELTDTESETDKDPTDNNEPTQAERDPLSENEIIIIEPPQPLITISLPQIAPVIPRPLSPPTGPPDQLVRVLEEICVAPLRMQKTKQLPFLRKNLRRGFRIRCNAIGVKTTRSKPKLPVLVRYEYMDTIYDTHISRWFCPLCELHGAFPNKEMLRYHMHWDHPEVILERWEQRTNNQGRPEWRIQILIPEVVYEMIQPRPYEHVAVKFEPQETPIELAHRVTPLPSTLRAAEEPSVSPTRSPPPTRLPSQTPSTSTREPSPRPSERNDSTFIDESKPDLRKLEPLEPPALNMLHSNRRGLAPQLRRASITSSWSSRSRTGTTELTEETLSTVRIEHSPGPAGGLYPSPPPVYDPLGPAAQIPYLPAKSEYDGPDIYYSCRPGGPTTFDLLGTLPMEPFGVLEWDILDREEEIYESDDVAVEFKVMHALWNRWITLNRLEFKQNFHKGTIAFIDMYWRMIHQAAGWRAMRYWLLLLLSRRFLTEHEVAKALRHYQNLTGMTYW